MSCFMTCRHCYPWRILQFFDFALCPVKKGMWDMNWWQRPNCSKNKSQGTGLPTQKRSLQLRLPAQRRECYWKLDQASDAALTASR